MKWPRRKPSEAGKRRFKLPKLALPRLGKGGASTARSIDWKLDFDLDRNPTLARFRGLSRGGKVAVVGVVVLLAWVALEQWSWSWARSWAGECERIERALADSRELAAGADPVAVTGAELYGPVDPPSGESEGAEAMAQAVVDIVKRHGTAHFTYDAQRASTRLSGAATLGGAQRLSKVSGEVQFEATPAEAAKIVAELEASSAVESISALRIQKRENEGKVVVRLTVEAWVYPAPKVAGRTGA